MKPIDVPEMQTYLLEAKKSIAYDQLLRTDLEALEIHSEQPDGRDWSDFEGQGVLASYWLSAEAAESQALLGHITHLRALAWHAVHDAFP